MSAAKEFLLLFDENQKAITDDFFHFLRFKSISSEPEYKNDLLACADWLKKHLKDAGLDVQVWETTGHPVIFASWLHAGPDKPTILLYGHYDVQPVDPIELWDSPPFEPTLRDGNLYARGASDNKGQCFYTVSAIKYYLKKHGSLPVNVKLCIEGEEEVGSSGLNAILKSKAKELKADSLLIVDVGIPDEETPVVTLGARGIVSFTITFEGSNTDLHSGVHGGLAYNPNRAMSEVIAKLYDASGRVAIPGFYDNIQEVSSEVKDKLWKEFNEKAYREKFGAQPVGGESSYSPLERATIRPTIEVNGVNGGYSGEGFKTVIPAKALLKLSCRLVPNQNPEKIGTLVKEFILANTPTGIKVEVKIHPGVGRALWTTAESTIVKASAKALSGVLEKPCGYLYCGGTIPILANLQEACGGDVALIGFDLPTDRIHAPNEHFSLPRLKKGFATICSLLTHLAD